MKEKIKKVKIIKKAKIKLPELEDMLKAGVHFGHKPSKWHPKMKPYIFSVRNNVHIIDLEKTQAKLEKALSLVQKIKEKQGLILFVGTKAVAKAAVKESAEEAKMPYIVERWLGGTFTNFENISKRITYFRDLEEKKKKGELDKYTKKERLSLDKELSKLNQRFSGIKDLNKMPEAIFVVDCKHEQIAIKEAKAKKIPIIGICDTNSDPGSIDYPIPANDEASSSIKLILKSIVANLK